MKNLDFECLYEVMGYNREIEFIYKGIEYKLEPDLKLIDIG